MISRRDFPLEKDGVRLITLGNIPQGGGGCFCPESALLKSFLSHVLIERDDYVIVEWRQDLNTWAGGPRLTIDALIVVVEPGRRSFQTAGQVKKLSEDLGIKRVYVVGNKVADEKDLQFKRTSVRSDPSREDEIQRENYRSRQARYFSIRYGPRNQGRSRGNHQCP